MARWPWAVIGVWVAMAIALPLAVPSLSEMAEKNPLAILPSDAPSSVTAQKMIEAFHEPGNDDLMIIALINEDGLGPRDEATYRKLVDALHDDPADVVMVQDFVSTPQLRQFLTSEDKKTWVLPVGLAGELGTPRAFDSFNRVADIVEQSVVERAPAPTTCTSPVPRPPSPTSPSQVNAIACRSRSRSPSWSSSCCCWSTAARSRCCCRW